MKSDTPPSALEPKVGRLIDANLNRIREGIRVIEDINRYIFDNQSIAAELKRLRHQAKIHDYKTLLQHRDIEHDVLKGSTQEELKRADIQAVLIANYKRAQESARVLEEAYKLVDAETAQIFKQVRYELYRLEQANLG